MYAMVMLNSTHTDSTGTYCTVNSLTDNPDSFSSFVLTREE